MPRKLPAPTDVRFVEVEENQMKLPRTGNSAPGNDDRMSQLRCWLKTIGDAMDVTPYDLLDERLKSIEKEVVALRRSLTEIDKHISSTIRIDKDS